MTLTLDKFRDSFTTTVETELPYFANGSAKRGTANFTHDLTIFRGGLGPDAGDLIGGLAMQTAER